MKITAVDSCILRVPTQKPIALEFPEQKLVVAHIRTDEGLTGLGYTLAMGGGGAESIQVYLETRLKPLLLGQDPLFVERLWERMYRSDRGIKRQGVAGYALSALDIGLWDIVGKAAKLPLFKVWGAVTDHVPTYGSGGWPGYSTDDLVAEALRYKAAGCRYYKMKIHDPDPRVNRRRVEAVRAALGDGVRMMVDANQKLDVLGNIRQAAVLEEFDLVWYEEPVLADDLAACAEVARAIRSRSPPARTTTRATSSASSSSARRRAISCPTCAGRTATARPCASRGSPPRIRCRSRRTWCTSCRCSSWARSPNGFLVEWIDWAPADLFEGMPRCEDGHFRISDRPGHGLALAPDAERKYRLA